MTVTFTPERWRGLLEDADFEPYSYSGRAMYGKACVAVTVPPGDVLALGARLAAVALAALTDDEEPTDPLEIAYATAAGVVDAMESARQDGMGLDAVVYWPAMAWTGGE